ncbi:MAG: hypothetical protein ACQGVK_16090, partial [Myxococcota bacterium]
MQLGAEWNAGWRGVEGRPGCPAPAIRGYHRAALHVGGERNVSIRNLEWIFDPKSIAHVGAS